MDIKTIAMIRRLLSTITWQKLVQVTILVLILVFAWTLYQSRIVVYNYVFNKSSQSTSTPIVKLSTKSQEAINDIVNSSDLVIGMHVTVVDFQKNTKTYAYFYIKDAIVLNIYRAYALTAPAETPLFNNDVENNKRLIKLLNGEFLCVAFAETPQAILAPAATKYISTICLNGIPPVYGKFTGIISLYTRRQPTETEIDQIRAILQKLSAEIYARDIK